MFSGNVNTSLKFLGALGWDSGTWHSEGVLALGKSQGIWTAKALRHSGTRGTLFKSCFIKIYRSAVFEILSDICGKKGSIVFCLNSFDIRIIKVITLSYRDTLVSSKQQQMSHLLENIDR